jgi:transcriptional antiterminator RfaH
MVAARGVSMQPYWACAQLLANRERLALHHLEKVGGYEIYCPRIAPPRRGKSRKPIIPRLLFPGYTFLRVVGGWWSARWAPGVIRIVLDAGVPAKVSDAVISELKGREVRGLVELPCRDAFKRGDRIKITQGAFAGQLGLFQDMRGPERVLVLLALLGGQQRVELAKDAIETVR